MTAFSISSRTVLLGFILGLAFGLANLVFSSLYPLADDTPAALLGFYGPMFVAWGVVSLRAARQSGRLASGVATGIVIAFATFVMFNLIAMLRVNVFLYELAGREDWQNMMMRFRQSGSESLRLFVNLDYAKQTPLKLAAFCAIGGLTGMLGGSLGQLMDGRIRRIST
jgi:hypothetical protein